MLTAILSQRVVGGRLPSLGSCERRMKWYKNLRTAKGFAMCQLIAIPVLFVLVTNPSVFSENVGISIYCITLLITGYFFLPEPPSRPGWKHRDFWCPMRSQHAGQQYWFRKNDADNYDLFVCHHYRCFCGYWFCRLCTIRTGVIVEEVMGDLDDGCKLVSRFRRLGPKGKWEASEKHIDLARPCCQEGSCSLRGFQTLGFVDFEDECDGQHQAVAHMCACGDTYIEIGERLRHIGDDGLWHPHLRIDPSGKWVRDDSATIQPPTAFAFSQGNF